MALLKAKTLFYLRSIFHWLIRLVNYRAVKVTGSIEELSIPNKSCFFGYHDLDPSFDNGNKVLSHVYSGRANEQEAIKNEIEVGYFEKKDGIWSFYSIGRTSAWCWQQGARLQFLNNDLSKDLILYNRRLNANTFQAICYDIDKSQVVKSWPYAFNVISKSGKLGGVLNYGLLGEKRPGYGYYVDQVDETPFIKVVSLKDDEIVYEEYFGDSVEYINHMHFSPDDRYLIFFKFKFNTTKTRDRSLCVIDLKTKKLVNELTDVNFSHFCWVSNTELILSVAYKLIWEARKYNVETGQTEHLSYLEGDFHPFYIESKGKLIFDTYPIKGKRFLLRSDLKMTYLERIYEFNDNPNLNKECRVDLHPRFMSSLDKVHIDVGHLEIRRSKMLSI
jgi:hypothetical protein